jgi:hypothetical protein
MDRALIVSWLFPGHSVSDFLCPGFVNDGAWEVNWIVL